MAAARKTLKAKAPKDLPAKTAVKGGIIIVNSLTAKAGDPIPTELPGISLNVTGR